MTPEEKIERIAELVKGIDARRYSLKEFEEELKDVSFRETGESLWRLLNFVWDVEDVLQGRENE